MKKVTVYKDCKKIREYIAEITEVLYECGEENVYIENDGIRTKVVTAGNFGSGTWGYEIEEIGE